MMNGFQPGWLKRALIVFKKEIRDHTRDKRSIVLSLVFPLMAPVLLGLLLSSIADVNVDGGDVRRVIAPVAGADYAPGLIRYFETNNVAIIQAPISREEQETAVAERELPFVLVIPERSVADPFFSVDLIVNRSSTRSNADAAQIMRHITAYGRLQAERMAVRAGQDTRSVTPVTVQQVRVGRAPNTAHLFYNMIPALLIFMVFMGAVYLAIDTTVGERERGSLEPLLSAPVARWELLLGKSFAAFCFTAVIVAINLLAFNVSLSWATAGSESLAAPPDAGTFAAMFLIALPLMALGVAVQMSISSVTRSAKEAQIYLGLLPIVPLIPGLLLAFKPVSLSLGLTAIPIFGQIALFGKLISEEAVFLPHILLVSVTTFILSGVIFYVASRLFEREKLIFGT